MKVNIYNDVLKVNHIQIANISASSVVIVGDADYLQLASTYDTTAKSNDLEEVIPIRKETDS